uniref:Secreted protein n=1 Tax=Haemonchus placei TaxID=6290 RepID=A0A0N4WWN9_HAEPC
LTLTTVSSMASITTRFSSMAVFHSNFIARILSAKLLISSVPVPSSSRTSSNKTPEDLRFSNIWCMTSRSETSFVLKVTISFDVFIERLIRSISEAFIIDRLVALLGSTFCCDTLIRSGLAGTSATTASPPLLSIPAVSSVAPMPFSMLRTLSSQFETLSANVFRLSSISCCFFSKSSAKRLVFSTIERSTRSGFPDAALESVLQSL